MNDHEWRAFAAEVEASFRGDLAEDREMALRVHIGEEAFEQAREALHRIVRSGETFMPAPADFLAELAAMRSERRYLRLIQGGKDAMKPGQPLGTHQALIDRQAEGDPRPGWDEVYGRPCSGVLVVIQDDGQRPVVAECDACEATVSVPQPTLATTAKPR